MDERALRDVERWKDKIEVRLDNRQVFVLFFGSALVACLLFILGVIVGKRLESRGRAVAPEIEDPLALLDKVATTPPAATETSSFPKPLFGGAAPKPTGEGPRANAKAAPAADPGAKTTAAAQPVVARAEPKAATPAPPLPPRGEKPAAAAVAADAAKPKGRFTLQLSSFQDRAEAEAFAKRFGGERPYVVVSEIPGKGTWYRVRVGEFASNKDAVAAKAAFEKRHGVIALVAPR